MVTDMNTEFFFETINRIDQIRPDAPSLAEFGVFMVGVTTEHLNNPNQIDVLNIVDDQIPRYDRPLTIELWYPAADGTIPGTCYPTLIRDGVTPTTLTGRASRDARPATELQFPLIILSHGFPGNRYLLSHFGENLASKGYVVASIDHTDSTYADQAAFGSTLVNRPLDQQFVISALTDPKHQLASIIDSENIGIIGYSMGAYGALITGGAGVAQTGVTFEGGAPSGLLAQHLAGSKSHEATLDHRVKAIVPIGPWGRQHGFWDSEGMRGLRVPTLIIAGSEDDISDYRDGIFKIFEEATNTERYLLTFENAGHNAAAPIPAPVESWRGHEALDNAPFDHYADPVWDTVRMNNIAQHFVTAFIGLHLKQDSQMADYLTPDQKGTLYAGLLGYPKERSTGVRLERCAAGSV